MSMPDTASSRLCQVNRINSEFSVICQRLRGAFGYCSSLLHPLLSGNHRPSRHWQIVAALALVLTGSAEAAGFRMLDTAGGTGEVWYPTEAPVTRGRLGPFDVEYAFGAAPAPELWPPVLVSQHPEYSE